MNDHLGPGRLERTHHGRAIKRVDDDRLGTECTELRRFVCGTRDREHNVTSSHEDRQQAPADSAASTRDQDLHDNSLRCPAAPRHRLTSAWRRFGAMLTTRTVFHQFRGGVC
jgi:hypothetical protein